MIFSTIRISLLSALKELLVAVMKRRRREKSKYKCFAWHWLPPCFEKNINYAPSMRGLMFSKN
jgi:hypothetical protein